MCGLRLVEARTSVARQQLSVRCRGNDGTLQILRNAREFRKFSVPILVVFGLVRRRRELGSVKEVWPELKVVRSHPIGDGIGGKERKIEEREGRKRERR